MFSSLLPTLLSIFPAMYFCSAMRVSLKFVVAKKCVAFIDTLLCVYGFYANFPLRRCALLAGLVVAG